MNKYHDSKNNQLRKRSCCDEIINKNINMHRRVAFEKANYDTLNYGAEASVLLTMVSKNPFTLGFFVAILPFMQALSYFQQAYNISKKSGDTAGAKRKIIIASFFCLFSVGLLLCGISMGAVFLGAAVFFPVLPALSLAILAVTGASFVGALCLSIYDRTKGMEHVSFEMIILYGLKQCATASMGIAAILFPAYFIATALILSMAKYVSTAYIEFKVINMLSSTNLPIKVLKILTQLTNFASGISLLVSCGIMVSLLFGVMTMAPVVVPLITAGICLSIITNVFKIILFSICDNPLIKAKREVVMPNNRNHGLVNAYHFTNFGHVVKSVVSIFFSTMLLVGLSVMLKGITTVGIAAFTTASVMSGVAPVAILAISLIFCIGKLLLSVHWSEKSLESYKGEPECIFKKCEKSKEVRRGQSLGRSGSVSTLDNFLNTSNLKTYESGNMKLNKEGVEDKISTSFKKDEVIDTFDNKKRNDNSGPNLK